MKMIPPQILEVFLFLVTKKLWIVAKAYLNIQFSLFILSVLKFLCKKIQNPENPKIQRALVHSGQYCISVLTCIFSGPHYIMILSLIFEYHFYILFISSHAMDNLYLKVVLICIGTGVAQSV
jgi:hypothetical protein